MTIYFYKRLAENGYLSNFSHYSFEIDGVYWPTSEHYFQAQKFLDSDYVEKIRNMHSPMEAAKAGRNRMYQIKENWDVMRIEVMQRAVYHKFSQNEEILKLLLATGEEPIVEQTIDDYFWGIGDDGSGINMLGKILVDVREKIRKERFTK